MVVSWKKTARPEYKNEIDKLREVLVGVARDLTDKTSERDIVFGHTQRLKIELESLAVQIENKKSILAQLDATHTAHQNRINEVVSEHSRIMSEHAAQKLSTGIDIEKAQEKLRDVQYVFSSYTDLCSEFEQLSHDISELKTQRDNVMATSLADEEITAHRTLEINKLQKDIDGKIAENGRILRDISVVRSDLYVYAARLQKYYDHLGLKISVDEIMDKRMPK